MPNSKLFTVEGGREGGRAGGREGGKEGGMGGGGRWGRVGAGGGWEHREGGSIRRGGAFCYFLIIYIFSSKEGGVV